MLLTIVALMAVAVMPLGIALAQGADSTRILPDKVYGGETFNVTVTFSAPGDDFRLISLTDLAPGGWNVTVNETWCTPTGNATKATDNKAEITWGGSFSNGTSFSAVYRVAVPEDADAGFHTFVGSLGYYLGSQGPYYEDITGNSQVEVMLRTEISFSPANLSFSAVKGGADPANEMLEIWNSGEGMLNWSLSDDVVWLSEAPVSGNSTGEHDNVTVAANITGMSAGDYSANITISAAEANNTPQVVPVSLHVSPPTEISLSPANLSFSAVEGGANPVNKTLEIWNSAM